MNANGGHEEITIKQFLSIKHLRLPFFIWLVADLSSRIGGFNIENFYSTDIMIGLGMPLETAALFNVVILRFPSIIFVLITLILIKKLNSRPYLLALVVGGNISVSLLFLAQVYNYFKPGSTLCAVLGVISLFLGITSFHSGLGYLPKFLPGVCCPQISRSLTTAYQVFVVGVVGMLITVAYPPLVSLFGPQIALVPMIIGGYSGLAWLWKYLPETKDKSVDEVLKQWMDDVDVNRDKTGSSAKMSYGTYN